jgi:hypothetical protein
MRNEKGDQRQNGGRSDDERGENKLNETSEAREEIRRENEGRKTEQGKRKGKERRQTEQGIGREARNRGRE